MLRTGLLLAVSQGLSVALALVNVRVITELIEPSMFGSVALFLGIAQLAEQAFSVPLQQTTSRFYARAIQGRTDLVGPLRALAYAQLNRWAAIFWGLILAGSLGYCAWSGSSPLPYILVAGYGALLARNELERSLINAAEQHRTYALWTVTTAALQPGLIGLALWTIDRSPAIVLLGYALAQAISRLLFSRAFVRRAPEPQAEPDNDAGAPPQPDLDPDTLRAEYRQFLGPMTASGALNWVSRTIDRYLIAGLIDRASAGIYTAAFQPLNQGFTQLNLVFSRLFNPRYYQSVSKGKPQQARKALGLWTGLQLATGGVVCVLLFPLADWVVWLLLAPGYAEAASLLPWLAIGHLARIQIAPQRAVLVAQNRPRAVLTGRILGAVLAIATTIPLLWFYGLLGAAVAFPISQCLQWMIYQILIRIPRSALPEQAPV